MNGRAVTPQMGNGRLLAELAGPTGAHLLNALLIVAECDLVPTTAERLANRVAPALGLRVFPTPIEVPGFSIHAILHERVNKDPAHAWFRGAVTAEARERRAR